MPTTTATVARTRRRSRAARRADAPAHARRVRRPGGAARARAGRCARRSSATCCSRSSSGARRAPARRRWPASIARRRRRSSSRSAPCCPASRRSRGDGRGRSARRRATAARTIVFIDEIHRFNKAQQDAFLPRVEAGDIVLIGATTENPSFEVNAALLSRSKVFVLQPLDRRGSRRDPRARARRRRARPRRARRRRRRRRRCTRDRGARQRRRARGAEPARTGRQRGARQRRPRRLDTRASVRRLVARPHAAATTRAARSTTTSSRRCTSRCATATPTPRSTGWRAWSRPARTRCTSRAAWCASRRRTSATPIRRRWSIAVAAKDAVHFIGMPEGNTALAQAAIYLATAPKSNAVYVAYNEAAEAAQTRRGRPGAAAPAQRADAADEAARLRQGLRVRARRGRRRGRHGLPAAGAAGRQFYRPTERGFEKEIERRLDGWRRDQEASAERRTSER